MRKLPETQTLPQETNTQALRDTNSRKHESAIKHVLGTAQYVDDVDLPKQSLHVATGKASIAKGKISSLNLDPVWQAAGVVDVITYQDIPGDADVSPVFSGDLLLAKNHVQFYGQAIFAVAARTLQQAKQAVLLAEVEYEKAAPILDAKQALTQQDFVLPTQSLAKGNAKEAIAGAPHRLHGELSIKGQDHFYLEGQISLAQATE